MANRPNQRGKARDSDSMARGSFKNADVLTFERGKLGVKRIFEDPFIDGKANDLEKSRLGKASTTALTNGFRTASFDIKNKYGVDNCGNMPQLGERTKASKRTTSIKQRHLS